MGSLMSHSHQRHHDAPVAPGHPSHEKQRKAPGEKIRDDSSGTDEFMSPEELGRVIDDLRAERRPAILEDQEP